MNWRKPLIGMAFRCSGRPVFNYLKYLKSVEYASPAQIEVMQNARLEKLLLHAHQNVPYYNKILTETGVVKSGVVHLDRFCNIPILTKDIIRQEGDQLCAKDNHRRKTYRNSSGGSTGVPVEFVQDKVYQAWGLAGRLLYNLWAGKDVGEKEIKFWGSERDLLVGKDDILTRLRRWAFNISPLNTYKMSTDNMRHHVLRWNRQKPKLVWGYTDSLYRFGQFIMSQKLKIHSPTGIICTTAKLLPEMRSFMERVYDCPVYDQYGSREVGPIASECRFKQGLHVFSALQKLEILDAHDRYVANGDMGRIIVTNLVNYSMPLIRYDIGDTGCLSDGLCACGRGFPLLKEVVGRVFSHFRRRDGGVVHSQFFVALFFYKDWIKEFKVVQQDYDKIEVLIAKTKNPVQEDLNTIHGKIKEAMGEDCQITVRFVDEVPPTASGKYLYTACEISAEST